MLVHNWHFVAKNAINHNNSSFLSSLGCNLRVIMDSFANFYTVEVRHLILG